MRVTRLLLVLLLSFSAGAAERWYVFSLGGTPVGYAVEQADGATTRNEVFARLTRLGKSIEMRFETVAIESDGGLQSLTYEVVLSKQPMRVEARVDGDTIRILSAGNERVIERGSARLLGPRAVERLSAERLRKRGDAFEYAVFSPELQRVAKVKRSVLATSENACDGTEAMKVEEAVEGMPAVRTFWMGADGTITGDEIASPFGPMRTCRSTKEAALAANGTLPADLYERTLARSNVRFADPFALDRVVLRVTRRDATQKLPDLVTHNQAAIKRSDDSVTIEVRRSGGAAEASGEFLKANALVESGHADIVKLAAELKRETPHETAQALTRWVAENLTMDAGIVMAPASELIRDRRATCMGYATLLAALGRAAGIPSRIAMGYVYYGGIWGGHAWTEMILDGKWVPLDAAVYAPGTAGAARLAAGASSFADGGGELNARLGPLFGRVDIDVLEYEQRGTTTRVAEKAKPFTVEGGVYENQGLGLRIANGGWTVERADSRWPSTLVVAFRRGENVVELHHRPAHPDRPLRREGDSLFVDAKGGMLWVWTARGPDAAAALRQFLR